MDIIVWPMTVSYSLVGLFSLTLGRIIETDVLIICAMFSYLELLF